MKKKPVLDIEQEWKTVSKFVFIPYNEAEYDKLVAILDDLLDSFGSDETHPLASLMDVIGALIEQYEDEHIPKITDLLLPEGVTQIEDE